MSHPNDPPQQLSSPLAPSSATPAGASTAPATGASSRESTAAIKQNTRKQTTHSNTHSHALTHTQSHEIPLSAEGVLGMSAAELDEVDSRSGDETLTSDSKLEAGIPEKRDSTTFSEKGGAGGEADEVEWTYPDGGLKAWGVVFGAHIFACCQMGYGLLWGVQVANLQQTTYPNTPIATLNLIAGLANFTMGSSAIVAGRLAERYGYKRMVAISTGCTLASLLLSAGVYKSLAGLFICQGVLLGASLGLGMPVYMSMPSQWFLKRRGLATGIAGAGTGVGGGISSLILRFLMPAVGYRKAMIIYACLNACLCCFAWTLLETRQPPLKPGERRLPKNWLPVGCWRDGALYSLLLCIFLSTFGYLNVPYFVTSYTEFHTPQLDKSSITPAIPLIIGNFVQSIGRVFAGFVADRIGPVNAFFLSYLMGGVLQIAMWPHVFSLGSITAFAILYGFFGSWFITLMPVVGAQLFGVKGLATLTGLLLVANAPGQFLGGTIGGAVLDAGAGYEGVAYYSGSMLVAGAVVLLYARFNRERRIIARF